MLGTEATADKMRSAGPVAESTPSRPPLDQLEQCMKLLSPKSSDEDKFVALVILPKLLDPSDATAVRFVFDRMNFKFIARLLRTPVLSSSDAQTIQAESMHVIAANIISCFCSFPDLASKPAILERVPLLANILKSSSHQNHDLHILIMQSFMQIASSSQLGLLNTFQPEIMMALMEILTSRPSKEGEFGEKLAESRQLAMQTLELLLSLISMDMAELVSSSEGQQKLLEDLSGSSTIAMLTLSKVLKNDQTKLKFDALKLMGTLISSMGSLIRKDDTLGNNLRDGLMQIVQSKLGDAERDLALTVSSMVIQIFGPQWLLPLSPILNLASSSQNTESKEKKPKVLTHAQFTTLLVHMACAEIRVRLDDDTLIRPAHTDSPESLSDSLSSLSLTIEDSFSMVLISSLNILEYFMAALIESLPTSDSQSVDSLPMPFEMILSIRKAMSESFMAIMASLVDRWEAYTQSGNLEVLDNPVVAHLLRSLAVWLVEETEGEGAVEEIQAVIPVLINICNVDFEKCKGVVGVELFAPAFNNMTADEKTRKQFVDHGGVDLIVNKLSSTPFLETDGRSVSVRVSLLGILLNVAVEDPETVGTSQSFKRLIDTLAEKDLAYLALSKPIDPPNAVHSMISTTASLFSISSMDPAHLSNTLIRTIVHASLKALAETRYLKISNPEKWLDVREFWYISSNMLVECISSNHNIPKLLAESPTALLQLLEMVSKLFEDFTDEDMTVLRVIVTLLANSEECKGVMKKVLTPGLLHKLGWGNVKALLNS
ncbi:hypothetical protein HDV05_000965 [Chytridiales sp. JEL 0842]|nr:hypothetical protein HDV05_000965 [Chytridiales sp. JEL 0842]